MITTTTTRLRRIHLVQLGLVLGLIYAVFAFLVALLLLIFGSVVPFGAGPYYMFGHVNFVSLILFPIAYFIAGFIGGVITAAIYNLVAGWTGGVELTFEAVT